MKPKTVAAIAASMLLAPGAEAGPSCDDWNTEEFFEAATVADVASCLEAGADPNARIPYGDVLRSYDTPLHIAAFYSPELVKLLIEAGADLEARNHMGDAPLHLASWHYVATGEERYREIVKLLLEAGADPNAKGNRGTTALHRAANEDRPEVVKLLLEAGANPNARDDRFETPLHWAHNREATKLLLEAGAHLEARDENLSRPLSFAIRKEALEIVKLLIEAGAEVNIKNELWEEGATEQPLHLAAGSGTVAMLEIVGLLLEAGADPNSRTTAEYVWATSSRPVTRLTPLHFAVYFHNPKTARLLLEAGADVGARDSEENTPLHLAAASNAWKLRNCYLKPAPTWTQGTIADTRLCIMQCTLTATKLGNCYLKPAPIQR